MKQKIFGPKIGIFVISILISGSALIAWQFIISDSSGQRIGIALGALVILAYCIGMIRWLGWPIEYRLDSHQLEIRTGKVRNKIDLDGIISARSCINFSLANNWSFSRIRIEYDNVGTNQIIYIAPKDISGFLKALSETSPELMLSGDSVVQEKISG